MAPRNIRACLLTFTWLNRQAMQGRGRYKDESVQAASNAANCNLADHSTGASTTISISILSRASNVVRRSSQALPASLFVEFERRIKLTRIFSHIADPPPVNVFYTPPADLGAARGAMGALVPPMMAPLSSRSRNHMWCMSSPRTF